jgi:hypothetical protein
MSDRLPLRTRAELQTRIETTLAAIQARAIDLSAEAIAAEVQADAEELAIGGVLLGLSAALGPELGAIALADITGRLAESDAEVARRLGLEHSTISKTLQRVRRNLGLPLRVSSNSRRGATKGNRAD